MTDYGKMGELSTEAVKRALYQRLEYKTVRTDTRAGLKTAERMHVNGWKQGRVGPFSTQFYRTKPR